MIKLIGQTELIITNTQTSPLENYFEEYYVLAFVLSKPSFFDNNYCILNI